MRVDTVSPFAVLFKLFVCNCVIMWPFLSHQINALSAAYAFRNVRRFVSVEVRGGMQFAAEVLVASVAPSIQRIFSTLNKGVEISKILVSRHHNACRNVTEDSNLYIHCSEKLIYPVTVLCCLLLSHIE